MAIPSIHFHNIPQPKINQRGSPLLQLPWEIREEIYSYIVIRDGTTYHTSRRFLGHTPSACFTITPILPSHITNYNNPFRTRPLPGSNRTRRKNRPIVIPEKDSLGTLPLVLKLFLTCRQTYAEARDVLFRHHTFSFDSPKVFMSWSGREPDRQIHNLRTSRPRN
ncbi:hypothetical protein DM02DRAFT_375834 [Periconia macrospinosa]|uniref:DUF7730 domain-containing protein n=1 Tax=Periconia macrospinosa TaxID=97972 RepID=A0A2V1DSJ5_9PLEO|nr:hypothetical protein DM02DRAFT_375834 [Periconia macrospinosa]